MISLLISLLVFALIVGLVIYIIGLFPLPPFVRQIAVAVIAVIFLIWLIEILLPGGGLGLRGFR